jgi:oxygen-dependent protoporphyrinogen oxidase
LKRIAIVGGGIAGLSAAYDLREARQTGARIEFHLYEASSRLGGVISSSKVNGTVLEFGPDSFLSEKPAALQLCRELGLEVDLIGSNDSARKTYILVDNKLVPLPDGLMFLVPTRMRAMARSKLFSMGTKVRMALETFRPPSRNRGDESVASLIARHYGQQAVDRLADPLLSGIYGGDATQLSAQAVLPKLVEMESRYGSLTRGTLEEARKRRIAAADMGPAGRVPRATFTTLRGGMQQLTDRLAVLLEGWRVHLETPVLSIERGPTGWSIRSRSGEQEYDSVIFAIPAWACAPLLTPVDATLGAELGKIPYTSSITVNLIYDQTSLGRLPEGFGFLVPAAEQRNLLALTFAHRKFLGRTAGGKAVLRAFLGGAGKDALLDEPDAAIEAMVRSDLRDILHVNHEPELVQIRRWPRAMAQYAVGHKDRQRKIQERLATLPGLHLVGNAYDGIGISDCIRLGRQAAKRVLTL